MFCAEVTFAEAAVADDALCESGALVGSAFLVIAGGFTAGHCGSEGCDF